MDEDHEGGRAVLCMGGFRTMGVLDGSGPSVAELLPSESELVFLLNRDVVPGWVPFVCVIKSLAAHTQV